MTSRSRSLAVALVVAAAPPAARALDAPHDLSNATLVDCESCHLGHNSPGGSLTSVAGNANLCQSCHSPGVGGPTSHGFPWVDQDQATPGTSGTSHSWSGAATNPAVGATPPTSPGLAGRLEGGNLKCSTCHDAHSNTGSARAGTQYTSIDPNVATTVNSGPNAGAGGRTLTLLTPAATAAARGYLVRFVTAGALAVARFKLSNDGGRSWRGCTAATTYDWIAAAAPPSTANGCQPGATLSLNDGANVRVTFAGTFVVNDEWRFHVAYPFLRIANAEAQMCLDCHASRNMTHTAWAGPTAGTTVFSHPVGVGLNANGLNHDRAPGAILDADGASTQATGDGNASNDLRLSPAGNVTCLTCHSVHNTDSNSLTADPN